MLYILVYLALFVGLNGEDIDLDLSTDQTDWIDPNDPFASPISCSKNTLDQLNICKIDLDECLKKGNSKEENFAENRAGKYCVPDPTLKHIVRNFLYRMNVDLDKAKRVDRTVDIYLSADSLEVLKKYLNSNDETVAQREQVREILEELIVMRDYEDRSFPLRIFDMIVICLPVLNIVLLMPAVVILYSNRFSARSLVWLTFFVSFIISVFSTYHRKQQENFAARMSRAEKSATERCKSKDFLSTATEMLSGLFFMKQKSECLQYYEDLYIDPLYEISPLDVVSDVLSNFIFTPLGIFGRHFNTFFNEFYRDSPLHMIVIKSIMFIFLVIALLFWLCGYRLRTLVATLEPAGVTYVVPQMIQPSNSNSSEDRLRAEILKPRPALSFPSRKRIGMSPSGGVLRRRSLSATRVTF